MLEGNHRFQAYLNAVLRRYTGAHLLDAVPDSETDFISGWAAWALSLVEEWREDVHMQEHPLRVHCSGLGGGLLSPDHEYDLFLQNHAQMKVYGPSLAMVDDWEQRIAQLGLTKATHEYAVYQLLATAIGWSVWSQFLPAEWANPNVLLTRAVRLLKAASIRPSHSRPAHPTWISAIQQILRCYHPQGKLLLLKACYPGHVQMTVPEGTRPVSVIGFSAGSYTGLALHSLLCEFACFPRPTKVAAIAAPPELLRLATGERSVMLIHCIEDRLCVWKPPAMPELSYDLVLIEGTPFWSGRARHAYGHLLFAPLDVGRHHIDQLQIFHPEVIPHGVRCEGLLRVPSWVSFDLPAQLKQSLSALLQAAGTGCISLHRIEIEGRDVRDPPIESEQALQSALIDMIPTPGGQSGEGGRSIRQLLTEFLSGFSLRTRLSPRHGASAAGRLPLRPANATFTALGKRGTGPALRPALDRQRTLSHL